MRAPIVTQPPVTIAVAVAWPRRTSEVVGWPSILADSGDACERDEYAVAELPAQSDPTASFGPNQWLVDELYEQYLVDKNAVDEAWWTFFDGYRSRGGQPGGGNGSAPTQPAPVTRSTPAPAPAPAAPSAPQAAPSAPQAGHSAPQAVLSAPSTPAPQPAQNAAPTAGEGDPAATKPAPDRAAHAATGAESKAASAGGDETSPAAPAPGAQAAPTPRDTPSVKNPKAEEQDVVKPIKGPAARIVTNMDASLQVPTATSVRAIPAKVMIDNRIGHQRAPARAPAAARSASPTSSATRSSRRSRRCPR